MKMMKHKNIALFVPHLGCPHQCSFCNQKSISGETKQISSDDVKTACETALKSGNCEQAEIAFFGGSFTAIDRDYMVSLLSSAYEYVRSGKFRGVRISTRPDCINEEILHILKSYGVTAIELGCQSMDDGVLRLNQRGHSVKDIETASALIKRFGFELGHQMMTGLYGSDEEKDILTAEKLIELKPDTVRIYPTVVLENTGLAEKYKNKEYIPQNTEDAIKLCAKLLLMFESADIPVIRLGLHSGGNVEEGYIAGAFHPAFREKCESEIYYEKFVEGLEAVPPGEIEITVSSRFVSQAIGHGKENIKKLSSLGYETKIMQNPDFAKYEFEIIPKGKNK